MRCDTFDYLLQAPDIAKKYWKLGENAGMRELLLAVRADEAGAPRHCVMCYTDALCVVRSVVFSSPNEALSLCRIRHLYRLADAMPCPACGNGSGTLVRPLVV